MNIFRQKRGVALIKKETNCAQNLFAHGSDKNKTFPHYLKKNIKNLHVSNQDTEKNVDFFIYFFPVP